MRRAELVLVTAFLCGCGTIANVGGGRWRNSQIYGGVLRDVKSAEDWIADYSAQPKTEIKQDVGVGVGVGLIALDLPFSAIGDTLTLPLTIPATLMRPRQPLIPMPAVAETNAAAKTPAPVPPSQAPQETTPPLPPEPNRKSAREVTNPDGSRK